MVSDFIKHPFLEIFTGAADTLAVDISIAEYCVVSDIVAGIQSLVRYDDYPLTP